jgi:hypothetical protein
LIVNVQLSTLFSFLNTFRPLPDYSDDDASSKGEAAGEKANTKNMVEAVEKLSLSDKKQ